MHDRKAFPRRSFETQSNLDAAITMCMYVYVCFQVCLCFAGPRRKDECPYANAPASRMRCPASQRPPLHTENHNDSRSGTQVACQQSCGHSSTSISQNCPKSTLHKVNLLLSESSNPQVTTSLSHHLPKASLPTVITSPSHYFPESPLF